MPLSGHACRAPRSTWAPLVACSTIAIVCVCGCRHSPEDGPASIAFSGSSVTSSGSDSSKIQAAPTEALELWRRTLEASRTSPGVARVLETRFAGSGADRGAAQFSVIESEVRRRGQTARYRLTYQAPDALKGVVILNDGHTVWRYNAHKRLIARQTSTTAPTPPELEEGVAAVPIQADGARPEIEPGPERVAGRVTQVLALRTAQGRRIVERRWVDKETGRTMRLEQYAGRDAHIVRRVEIEEFRLLKTPADLAWATRQFSPSFPATAHVVESGTSHSRHLAEAEDVARMAQLPVHVRGFALRSVARVPDETPTADRFSTVSTNQLLPAQARSVTGEKTLGSGRPPVAALSISACPDCADEVHNVDQRKLNATQFYYTKGNQALSIFVASSSSHAAKKAAPNPGPPPASGLVAGNGWVTANLAGDVTGFARTNANGAAVAWTGHGGESYIAVAHMPLSDLLPVIRAFAANRDDAPTTLAAGH